MKILHENICDWYYTEETMWREIFVEMMHMNELLQSLVK